MSHLRHLALEIGPRGSTTAQERQAAEFARKHFEALGLQTNWEDFTAPKSGWRPFSVAAVIGLCSVPVFLFGGRAGALIAGVIMLIATVSILLEMYFKPNPLRAFVPKGQSQNVWARVLSANQADRRVLIVGHLDTHRTPLVFTSAKWLSFFRVMTTIGVGAFVFTAILYLLSLFIGDSALRLPATVLVPIFLILTVLTVQPDFTPYTHGANDNASGASIVLSIAERLASSPLARTEVWSLCSGCEEVGSYGVQAFVERHRSQLPGVRGVFGIGIDNVGGKGAGVCYTSVEGMVIPYKPAPELIKIADAIKAERSDLNAYTRPFTVLHTDATCLMVNGVPSLSFVGLTPAGAIPGWHQVVDTFDRVDQTAIEATEEFVLELLRRLDAA